MVPYYDIDRLRWGSKYVKINANSAELHPVIHLLWAGWCIHAIQMGELHQELVQPKNALHSLYIKCVRNCTSAV